MIAFGIGLGLTSGSLWLLHTLEPGPHRGAEIAVLILANAVATVLRFLALRQLMGKPAGRGESTRGDLADDVV